MTAVVRHTGFMLATWECVLVNLGHVYRKAQQWQAAVDCYMKALGIAPGQASTYSALAYTHHLQVSFHALELHGVFTPQRFHLRNPAKESVAVLKSAPL